jgi:hypothetical protein
MDGWNFEHGEFVWYDAKLSAFDELFPNTMDWPTFATTDFVATFKDYVQFYTIVSGEQAGALDSESRVELLAALDRWRAAIDEVRVLIADAPEYHQADDRAASVCS